MRIRDEDLRCRSCCPQVLKLLLAAILVCHQKPLSNSMASKRPVGSSSIMYSWDKGCALMDTGTSFRRCETAANGIRYRSGRKSWQGGGGATPPLPFASHPPSL